MVSVYLRELSFLILGTGVKEFSWMGTKCFGFVILGYQIFLLIHDRLSSCLNARPL